MVGRGRGDDVALAGDLAGEAGDGAGHCGGLFGWLVGWLGERGVNCGGGGGGKKGWEGRKEMRGTLVDFAEDDDAGELGAGVARDDGVVEVYAWRFFCHYQWGCVLRWYLRNE